MSLIDAAGGILSSGGSSPSSASSALGTAFGIGEKLYDNYTSAKAATKAFDRQKWMAENAYQMKVSDLRKAGLNPALALGSGGAQFPGVAVARTDFGGASGGGLRMAQTSKTAQEEVVAEQLVDKMGAEIDLMIRQGHLAESARMLNDAKRLEVYATIQLTNQQLLTARSETDLRQIAVRIAGMDEQQQRATMESYINFTNSENWSNKAQADAYAGLWESWLGDALPFLERIPGFGFIVKEVMERKRPRVGRERHEEGYSISPSGERTNYGRSTYER